MTIDIDVWMEAIRGIDGLADYFGYEEVSAYTKRKWLETGDMKFVLMAVKDSAIYGRPIPEWAAKEYCDAYHKIAFKLAGSWDEVFGKPIKKRGRREDARRRLERTPLVWNEIATILEQQPQTPIDIALFEEVGKRLNMCKTLVGELWSQNPFREVLRQGHTIPH